MIETPRIAQRAERDAAVIHITVPREQIQSVMGPGFGEVMAALAAQGIAPAGPAFTHHLRMDPGVFDFELGVPVSAPVAPSGRVKPGRLPATTVVRTVYQGPYEGLGQAWGEFGAWTRANGHAPATDLWETYLVGPESSANPADWRTELDRPLVARG